MRPLTQDYSYRLAVLGNLTSSELRAAGYPGNNALRDQKCALQWIRSHVEGFGGDAENVTAFGVSAGSGNLLLFSGLIRVKADKKQLQSCRSFRPPNRFSSVRLP